MWIQTTSISCDGKSTADDVAKQTQAQAREDAPDDPAAQAREDDAAEQARVLHLGLEMEALREASDALREVSEKDELGNSEVKRLISSDAAATLPLLLWLLSVLPLLLWPLFVLPPLLL